MQDDMLSSTAASEIIDDLRFDPPLAVTGNGWVLVSDRVMGGISNGAMARETVAGRDAIRMTGGVSLENNGGGGVRPTRTRLYMGRMAAPYFA